MDEVKLAAKRLYKRYGVDGFNLLSPEVRTSMLYHEVLSPSTLAACFDHNREGTGKSHAMKLAEAIDSYFPR